MYESNDPRFKYLRKAVRAKSTYHERLLWEQLRDRRLGGYKFRRNHQIRRYYVDFYCHKQKLVIEVDGSIHEKMEQKEYDEIRDAELQATGFRVLRFHNSENEYNLNDVLNMILIALSSSKGMGET